MIQVMHAVLGTSSETRTVSLLYGSRTRDDVLAKPLLDDWLLFDGDRLNITYSLSIEPDASSWKGRRGFVDANLVKERIEEGKFPSPDDNCIIFVCGPDPMYKAICGARVQPGGFCKKKGFSGWLKELGYSPKQVYRF